MFKIIRKRDGREVPFDETKITDAIFKAARAVGGEDRQTAMELTIEVLKMLKKKYNGSVFGVEDVQDVVEKVLIEAGHARTAKAYILYRDRRTRIRDAKSDLMDAVEEILEETSRENANISNSPSAKMLQIASAASKKYYLSRLLPEEVASAHRRGDIHIHDLDYYGKTLNCLQIPLGRLLTEGFNTGHGYIRPPRRPTSATALAAIILQSSQNDMYGGQSFAAFDRDMAPFVEQADDFETYQAMEALVYNLNSMHSLRADERIWIYDRKKENLFTVSMVEFHKMFEPGRYMALSLNYQTGRTELKEITASWQHVNCHQLLEVKLKSGQKVCVTDNHSMMALDSEGRVTTVPPRWLQSGLTPACWQVPEREHVYDLTSYQVNSKYTLSSLRLDENLAWLMGLYVAEGSVYGSTVYLALFDRDLEQKVQQVLAGIHPLFTTGLRYDAQGRARDLVCRVGKAFAAFLADKCGRGASSKKVPSEIFFARSSVINAFLDGYLSGDGTVGKNKVACSTISQELRDGIYLLLTRLGLPASISQEQEVSTNFASAQQRYRLAIGGYYATALTISGTKRADLAELYHVTGEQTPYDYEYLRPLIAAVYGIKCRNAEHYRIKPLYIEELIFDLRSRLLTAEEKELVKKLANEQFWREEIKSILPDISSSERYHLQKLLERGELPRMCKYLPVFLPYADWLERFLLPLDLGMRCAGGRINNNCRSPRLIMRWAGMVLQKNDQMEQLLERLEIARNIRPVRVKQITPLAHEPYVYDISVADNENFLTAQGIFVHNSRAGAQVPFSSINLGTDTSEAGRRVTKALLLAYEAGLGRGENPIFPNIIFRVKEGVNFSPGDPNYDLFQLAVRVAAKRLNPTFSFMDASFNQPYGDLVSYMGCRSRVMANRRGPEITDGRGNLSFTTINLPRLAIKAERSLKRFYTYLDEMLRLTIEQLYHRFTVQARLKVKDMPFVMGQGLYLGSQGLGPCDPIEPAIVNGTLAVGFIGLAEALTALTGYHHAQSEEARELGHAIVAHMRRAVDEACEEFDLNYTLVATPAEGLSGRFVRLDRKEYGIIPGVTGKDYYTNSFHVPVGYPISSFEKISIEGPFHKYCNAGHISYVEMAAPPVHNLAAMEKIIRHMAACDMGYAAVNYPVDFCTGCGSSGVINEERCPACGCPEIRRVRRITGYLSTVDRFNDSKVAELYDRTVHEF
ncbi:MAG: anaerobic ribonucleoside-triphosphate reductase [Desulfurispora sp.]|uniref:anaerobic ribonucleoside-triphosphate reductase n=1 Tax=Desulfurispora sp. TaxID=3014275 RepID=UPI004049558C